MIHSFSLKKRNWYPWAFIATEFLAGVLLYVCTQWDVEPELILTGAGSIAAFFHFLFSQHNSDTQRFISLFKEFNERFDVLNEDLNLINENSANVDLTSNEKQVLYDYFNLCAEEYLFYKSHYIDEDVWSAWLDGMAHYAKNKNIRNLWEKELKQESYYGFSLILLQGHGNKKS